MGIFKNKSIRYEFEIKAEKRMKTTFSILALLIVLSTGRSLRSGVYLFTVNEACNCNVYTFFFSYHSILSDLPLFIQQNISQSVSGSELLESQQGTQRGPAAEVQLLCLSEPRLLSEQWHWTRWGKMGQANPYLHTQTHSKHLGPSGSQDCLVLGMAHMWSVLPHFGRFHSDIKCSVLVIHRSKSQPCNWLAKGGNSLVSEGTEAKKGQRECWRWGKTDAIDLNPLPPTNPWIQNVQFPWFSVHTPPSLLLSPTVRGIRRSSLPGPWAPGRGSQWP